jgi:hypothetical protein
MFKAQDTIFSDTSITADVAAQEVVDISRIFSLSLQLEWDAVAGSGTGSIITEASNDSNETKESESTWVQIDSQAIAGDSDAVFHNEVDVPYQKLRVRVTHASNTINSVTVKYSGKGI